MTVPRILAEFPIVTTHAGGDPLEVRRVLALELLDGAPRYAVDDLGRLTPTRTAAEAVHAALEAAGWLEAVRLVDAEANR
jgi:hypothetical protein